MSFVSYTELYKLMTVQGKAEVTDMNVKFKLERRPGFKPRYLYRTKAPIRNFPVTSTISGWIKNLWKRGWLTDKEVRQRLRRLKKVESVHTRTIDVLAPFPVKKLTTDH